jgi:hypothetical protein
MATARIQTAVDYPHTSTSTTVQHETRDGANRLLVVEFPSRNVGTITAPTYNGVSLTLMTGSQTSTGTGTSRRQVQTYYMIAPPVGSYSLVMATTSSDQGTIRARNFVDADQSTPFRSQSGNNAISGTGSASTSSSLSVATSADDLVIDVIAVSTTPTIGAGQTRVGAGTQPTNHRASSEVATGSSTSMDWTFSSGTYAHCAYAVIGATATQPDPVDYTGGRGKKSWIVASNLTGETVSSGATVYMPIAPTIESSGTESANRTRARVAGTYARPMIRISANASTGSTVYTLMEDGVATSVSITVGAGVTGLIEGTGTLTVDGTTALSWRCVNGGGGTHAHTMAALEFEPSGSDTVTILAAHTSSAMQSSAGTTTYLRVSGQRGADADELDAIIQSQFAATWRGIEVIKVGNTTTGTVDVQSRINGSDGNQLLQWAASGSASQEDTSNTDSVADGDRLCYEITIGAGSGTWETERWTSRLLNSDGEFLMVAGGAPGDGLAIPNGTTYLPISGELRTNATRANAESKCPFDMASKRFWIEVGPNTGLLACTFRLLINGSPSAHYLIVRSGESNVYMVDVWQTDEIAEDDLVCIEAVNGSANGAISVRSGGFVGIERVAGGSSYNVDIAESASAADAASVAVSIAAALSESSSASDVQSAAAALAAAITEAGSAADAASSVLVAVASASESASASEAVEAGAAGYSVDIAEASSASEAVSAIASMVAAVSEAMSASDSFAVSAVMGASVSESANAADATNWGGAVYSVDVAETATLTEAISAALQALASIAETGNAADAQAAIISAGVGVLEPAAAAEALASALSLHGFVLGDAGASDTVAGEVPQTYLADMIEQADAQMMVVATVTPDGSIVLSLVNRYRVPAFGAPYRVPAFDRPYRTN